MRKYIIFICIIAILSLSACGKLESNENTELNSNTESTTEFIEVEETTIEEDISDTENTVEEESTELIDESLFEIIEGDWVLEIDETFEIWSIDDKKITIDGNQYEYTTEKYKSDGIILIFDDKNYCLRPYGEAFEIVSNKTKGMLYDIESQDAIKGLKLIELSEATANLTERYPDNDGWIKENYLSDVPLLADPDYIEESLNEGIFFITTPEELASLCYYVNIKERNEYFAVLLMADLDLEGYEWAPMGNNNSGDHPFDINFFGQEHTIYNLTINSSQRDIGFIGWSTFAYVGDLNIKNANINGGGNVGILSGQAICDFYENCYVEGVVNGSSAGAMLGHSTSTLENCSADVIVNGEPFEYLTYNDKAKSEIVIDDLVTITIDENYQVTRPAVTRYYNLGWIVKYNGQEVLHRSAEQEFSYTYFSTSPGDYEIYLTAFVSGQYVAISNVVSYTI